MQGNCQTKYKEVGTYATKKISRCACTTVWGSMLCYLKSNYLLRLLWLHSVRASEVVFSKACLQLS